MDAEECVGTSAAPCSTAAMTNGYVLDNAESFAPARFANTGPLYDDRTFALLDRLGVGRGAHCLEVGGGGGSVAEWLSTRVGPEGKVVVTDLDPRHLESLAAIGAGNIEVVRHDVGSETLPAQAYDLVHARLVIMHVPERAEAIRRMAESLKPGGWLVIEDFDPHLVERGYGTRLEEGARLHQKACAAMGRLMAGRGAERGWARTLFGRFRDLGLVDVDMVGYLAMWRGGSPGARLDQANFSQVRSRLVEQGWITDAELDRLLEMLDDPDFEISSPLMFTAWGRRA
jgi:SAM-dependent methyltransferase